MPLIFRQDKAGNCFRAKIPEELKSDFESHRLIIDPGGVGQPRDGDLRASYAIYDNNAQIISHHRISYDITTTQKNDGAQIAFTFGSLLKLWLLVCYTKQPYYPGMRK